jgi:hypothetical protein
VAQWHISREETAMFDKFSRSWALAGQCWRVLKTDPALLLFPILSALALLVLLGSFAWPVWTLYHGLDPALSEYSTTHTRRLFFYVVTYGLYVVAYTVMFFFNAALISVALKRLDGEPASVGDGLRMAASNLPAILAYAAIAATVGTLLRAIEERVGLIGRIVTALIGAGWTLATAMTLPVLVEEGMGPVEAIARSLELLKSNWGENLIGNGGISLGLAVISVPAVIVALLVMFAAIGTHAAGAMVLGVAFFGLTLIGLALVSTTLHTIYTAALYRFAAGNAQNAGIDADLLAGAYRSK